MPTLMETIQKNMQQAASPNQMAQQSTQAADQATSQAQQLGQASTGKAAAPGAQPRATNLAAQTAAGQANIGAQQLQQQTQVQGEQLAGQAEAQKQDFTLQNKQLDENQLRMHDSFANMATQIAGELSRNQQQLDFRKQAAQMEQLGFAARLSNEKYVSQLQMEGERSQLMDAANFQEELQKSIFSDQRDLLESDMQFQIALNGKNNEWKEYLNSIDVDHMVDMEQVQRKMANEAAMIAGASKLASAGAQYGGEQYAEYNKPENVAARENASSTSDVAKMQSRQGAGASEPLTPGYNYDANTGDEYNPQDKGLYQKSQRLGQ